MYKKWITGLAVIITISAFAQRGDELVVYAVKGKVTCVYQNAETPVRIGKVLHAGMILKTEDHAALTMLCTRGKTIFVDRKGNYPVTKWKDSCRSNPNSITSNYFKYIWSQLYAYSPEHKEEMRKRNEMAVARGEPAETPVSKKNRKWQISRGLDTLNYDGRSFPISWNLPGYRGWYYFKLYDVTGRKLLYHDSLRSNYILLDSLQNRMIPGNRYRWTVAAKGVPVSSKRVIHYVTTDETTRQVQLLSAPLPITEDSAAVFFRAAFQLEQKHFLAEALEWYLKAGMQDPELELYRDQIIRFRNEFWIR